MKLWLDDLLDDPSSPERWTPEGWVGARTVLEAARKLKSGQVTHISFDHDLGIDAGWTGYTLAKLIEKWAWWGVIPALTWDIHSANPVGAENITRAMKAAEIYWKR
jgi:hypothetical protein